MQLSLNWSRGSDSRTWSSWGTLFQLNIFNSFLLFVKFICEIHQLLAFLFGQKCTVQKTDFQRDLCYPLKCWISSKCHWIQNFVSYVTGEILYVQNWNNFSPEIRIILLEKCPRCCQFSKSPDFFPGCKRLYFGS